MSQQTPAKRRAVRGLAFLLFVFACVALALNRNSFAIELSGLIALVAAFQLFRTARKSSGSTPVKWTIPGAARRPGRLAWILLAASLAACGVFYLFLRSDALHGGQQVWPLYALAVAVLALAGASGYVVVNILR